MARNSNVTNKQYVIWSKMMRLGKKIFGCHQLPERSFFYHGMQFPICARCTGLMIGFTLIGPAITIFTFGNMYFSLFLLLLMILDGVLQLKTSYLSNNTKRILTGVGAGYALFSILIHIVRKIINLINI